MNRIFLMMEKQKLKEMFTYCQLSSTVKLNQQLSMVVVGL